MRAGTILAGLVLVFVPSVHAEQVRTGAAAFGN
jgi:hypothetical protein